MTGLMPLAAWRAKGEMRTLGGHQIFTVTEGAGPVLVLLHGFPTASWDWSGLWPALAGSFRLITADMLGYGWSAKPRGHRYSILEQADLIEALLADLDVGPYHILAHDYGDTVAQELLARDVSPVADPRIQSACFLNGGMFPEVHRATGMQKALAGPFGALFARLLTRQKLRDGLTAIFGPDTPPDGDEIDGFWQLVTADNGRRAWPKLLGYMAERRRFRDRWVGAVQAAACPMRLINGTRDPISGGHMADRYQELVPAADVVRLGRIGHYPQVEAPEAVLAGFQDFHEKVRMLA